MVLNKKLKKLIFTEAFSKADLMKIFDTTDVEWLVSQKVVLKDDIGGWKKVFLNGEEYTSLNFTLDAYWIEIFNNIDDYRQCEWCEEWFLNDEIETYHRWKVCHSCKLGLWSRGE